MENNNNNVFQVLIEKTTSGYRRVVTLKSSSNFIIGLALLACIALVGGLIIVALKIGDNSLITNWVNGT